MAHLLSLIGIFVVLFIGILLSGAGIITYLEPASFFIVLVSSFLATSLAVPFSIFRRGFSFFRVAMVRKATLDYGVMRELMVFADKARKDGLLALDNMLDGIRTEFLRTSVQMVIDGIDPKLVRHSMQKQIEALDRRHRLNSSLYEVWGKLAPAFGLIGTLIGLIALLTRLEDRAALGSGMAIALITTFYGAILANAIFIPIRNKLESLNESEILMMEIISEGIDSLQSGDAPKILEKRLISFLSNNQQISYVEYIAENPL